MKFPQRIVLELIYAILVFGMLDLLPFGFKTVGILFAFTIATTIWLDPRHRAAMAFSIAAACFAVNLVLPAFMNKTYYRPYERLSKRQMPGFKQYAPNQDVNVEKSHGDLVALGFNHPDVGAIREERPQRFVIDANGYRQTTAKGNGDFQAVLAGDSFVEGIGVTTEQTLPAQLASRRFSVYNLGHNGDIGEYLAAAKYAREHYGVTGPVFLYAFEGNDFAGRNYCVNEDSALATFRDSHRALKELHLSRFLAALYGRLRSASERPSIRVVEAAGKKIAFLEEYLQAASAPTYDSTCLRDLILRNKHFLSAIFFVPEKSRVYDFLLADTPAALKGVSAYGAALAEIARELQIPFVDLTEPLRKKARTELLEGRFVFWRDDTHWNPIGIAVAVKETERLLTNPHR